MPRIFKYPAIAALFAVFFLLSCSKDDEPTLSKTELLTQNPWRIVKTKTLGVEAAPEACDADDIYTISASGSYTQDEGATKCDPADTQTIAGTWVFKNEEKTISVTLSGLTIDLEILELTSTRLRVKYLVPIFNIEVEDTYEH